MTQRNLSAQRIHNTPLGKCMLLGALIALVFISLFMSGAVPDASWSKYWKIRPMIMVPLAGAMGGVFYYFMDFLRFQGGWKKAAANIISLLAYIIAVWIGIVLGLDGTMWD